ncbi:WXG100 family type VII secretion target [Nocardioides litoris]|uniref:WXG100 family type VII secretion target n=1 Tax=Nocardioides litoris TaxID=1926648 RepID=UPI0011217991|nr:hypothetical protein [Nocardioides litoris]
MGVDAGIEAAVRVNQGFCIYAGCFPINVVPPPLPISADLALTAAASRVPAINTAATGILGSGTHGDGVPGYGITSNRKKFLGGGLPGGRLKLNTATAWMMDDGLGGPFALHESAEMWADAARQLGEARGRLESLVSSLGSDQWSGDDRDAFEVEVQQLALQIGDAQTFAEVVSGTLRAAAIALGVWPVGCTVVGAIQFANASLFYAAVASIVGNLGPSQAVYAQGLASSVLCNRNFSYGLIALKVALGACAAVITGAGVVQAIDQGQHGDGDATADLTRAVVDMAVTQGANNLLSSGLDVFTGNLETADKVFNPQEYLGANNNRMDELLDQHLGDLTERLGDEAGQAVVPDEGPDTGPYSGG